MKKKKRSGFTLVELLAVIVILAIILVIAVPQIMDTINNSREGTFASSAKLIVASAEKEYLARKTLGDTSFEELESIPCEDVVETTDDYEWCNIEFYDNGKAKVSIKGANKFAGKNICNATREEAIVSEEECPSLFERHDWEKIISNVTTGKHPYKVGDIKEIELLNNLGTHMLRVSNVTKCDSTWMADTLKSQTACGFVLEFVDIIKTYQMNTASSNLGGWKESLMRKHVNNTIYNAIPEPLKSAIINTNVISSYASSSEGENFISEDKLYLLSPEEIYGISFTSSTDTSIGTSRQLEYYKNNNVTTENNTVAIKTNSSGTASIWWLRSAVFNNSANFSRVYSTGDWGSHRASKSYGISPAFRIG